MTTYFFEVDGTLTISIIASDEIEATTILKGYIPKKFWNDIKCIEFLVDSTPIGDTGVKFGAGDVFARSLKP